jgi:hypothetical protein
MTTTNGTAAPAPLDHFPLDYLTGARLVSVNGIGFTGGDPARPGLLIEDVRLRRVAGITFFELTVWMGPGMISLTIAGTDTVEVTR